MAGTLDTLASGSLATHAEDCPKCQAVLEELADATVRIRGLGPAIKSANLDDEPPQEFLERLQETLPQPPAWSSYPPPKEPSREARPAHGGEEGFPEIPGYEILAELGRGGMGIVYQARQVNLNRLVAVKMVLAGSSSTAEDRGRFRTEAEVAARLRHPNLVQIYEAWPGTRAALISVWS